MSNLIQISDNTCINLDHVSRVARVNEYGIQFSDYQGRLLAVCTFVTEKERDQAFAYFCKNHVNTDLFGFYGGTST